jgi:hypothetical protein
MASMMVRSSSVSAPSISRLDLFAEGQRHIAHHARQLVPHHADGLHARLHDAFLQFGGDQVQPLRGGVESGILALGVELKDLVAGKHQFPHQIHELVEQADSDADVGIGFAWDYYGCGHTSGEAVAWREDFGGEKAYAARSSAGLAADTAGFPQQRLYFRPELQGQGRFGGHPSGFYKRNR